MSNDVENLGDTIKPKSDQLNADDLLLGPITVNIVDVKRGSADQPVSIAINGHMPFKPCKTMRRVLVTAWGQNGKEWVNKSMTLYCDPNVKFGGVALGGIRISHLSHIDGPMNMMLTASRGRKSQVVVHPIKVNDYTDLIKKYTDTPKDDQQAFWDTLSSDQKTAISNAYNQG